MIRVALFPFLIVLCLVCLFGSFEAYEAKDISDAVLRFCGAIGYVLWMASWTSEKPKKDKP